MGFGRMEVKIVSKNGKHKDNSALAHSAYICGDVKKEFSTSAVAGAAYISGNALANDMEVYDYRQKKGVLYRSDILLPQNAPKGKNFENPEVFWQEVDSFERGVLYREFICSFPRELMDDDNEKGFEKLVQIASSFANTLVEDGMAVEFAIHDEKHKNGNYHAHFMATTRGFNEDGTWAPKQKKQGYLLDAYGNKIPIYDCNGNIKSYKREPVQRINDWDSKDKLLSWRKSWEVLCNEHLPQNFKIKMSKDMIEVDDKEIDYQINTFGHKRTRKEQMVYERQMHLVDCMDEETKNLFLDEILRELQSQYRRDYYAWKNEDKQDIYEEKQIIYQTRRALQRELYFIKRQEENFKFPYVSDHHNLFELVLGGLILFLKSIIDEFRRGARKKMIESALQTLSNDLLLINSGIPISYPMLQNMNRAENMLIKRDFETLGEEIKRIKKRLEEPNEYDDMMHLKNELDLLRNELHDLEVQRDLLRTQLCTCSKDDKVEIYMKSILSLESMWQVYMRDLFEHENEEYILENNYENISL